MEKNVVREDIIQIGFDVNDQPLTDINNQLSSLTDGLNTSVSGVEKELNNGISDMNNALSDTVDVTSELTDGMSDMSTVSNDFFESATDGITDLETEVETATDDMSDFSKEIKNISTDTVDNLTESVESVTDELGAAAKEGADFVTKLADIGKSGAEESLESIADELKDTESGFENTGDAGVSLADMVGGALQAAGITLTLKGITDAAYELADAFSDAESIVVQATGATGEALDGLTQSMMNVYAVSKTGSLDDVAAAVGEINTRLGYTGQSLEDTTEMFVDFAAATGSNAKTSVRNVTQLMNQWGVSGDQMGSVLDKLTYAGQASGINVDTLSSQLLNNKAILDELGFSLDEATAMFMNFELAGTNTSQVLMGFRSALSSGAITSLDDLKQVFQKLTDGTMSAQEASDMFGTRAGVTIKNAAQMGVFSLDDLVNSLNQTGGLLEQTAEDAQTMSQKWEQSTKGIKTAFTTALQPIIEKITDSLTGMLSSFGEFLNKNPTIVKGITATVAALGGLATFKFAGSIIKNFKGISSLFGDFGKQGKSVTEGVNGTTGIFESLAKAKPTTILKGIANLAIIIGGLTAIAAGLMAIAPYMSKLSDVKSLVKIISVIAVLGVVGAGLSKLAGVVGKIPVSSVALGLANIAIIVAGMSALYLLIGAVSLINFDLNRILQIALIIGVLGTVGAVLSAFAGLVGMIPIPVVLLGLANIALVLAGISAIIIAFGALSEIPHFDEFISKGGATLANLFNQIGNIAGSLIGGFGEGVTASLPVIGENLSAFAQSIQPLISTLGGADVSGIGDFFSSIGAFLLSMAAEGVLSLFTGGLDLVGLGTQLTAFATSSEDFFTKVAGFPENGFTNAALLFQSLADIGNVPNTGGIAQWFSGTNDFEALAQGLIQLSSDGVIGFFNKMSGLAPECFDNAQKLFQSLSDIGNIPNTGGVAQWFSGTNDFEELTQNLPPFGEAMAQFYESISSISDFTKASQLFEALHGIGEAFPNSGGIAQWFSGENDISGTGNKLKEFGESTKEFFSSVTALNVDNLKGVFEAVKTAGEAAKTDLSGLPDKGTKITEFMTNAKGFFTGAGEVAAQLENVNAVAVALQNFFGVVSGIVDTSLTDINGGLQTTVTLIATAMSEFNELGVVIVTSTQTGAAAFIAFQSSVSVVLTAVNTEVSSKTKKMMSSFNSAITSGVNKAVSTVKSGANSIKTAFNGINLTSAGSNMMQGLINGINSKKSMLLETVRSLATTVNTEWQKLQEMHSPSKLWQSFGAYLVEGLNIGITDNIPKAEETTQTLAQVYTPEKDASTTNNNNTVTENNTYNPVFNLTINGSDNDRAIERKIKQMIKKALNEIEEENQRKNKPVQVF